MPSRNYGIKVEGIDELMAKLRSLNKSVAWKINYNALHSAAKVLRESVIAHIPSAGIRTRTGNLKNSVQQSGARGGLGRKGPNSEVYVYTRKKGGFHAHLLEFGHNLVVWSNQPYNPTTNRFGKVAKFFGSKRRVGFVKARPFFRPALDDSRTDIINRYAAKVMEGINAEVGK